LKRYKQLFQEAERLTPPPGLWRKIAAQVKLKKPAADGTDSGSGAGSWSWESPFLRAAAAVVLAVGLLATGYFLGNRTNEMASSAPTVGGIASSSVPADDGQVIEIFDSELLGWQAELGETSEMDSDADEAEEVL
jgi:hypothetical protein